ncbi:thioredoxin family protein [Pedobacter sp.]|uniref:thioredoxin family protein n=1 Tax=Pedobacter sp. TaxID=1411316 RepID=UPI002C4D8CDD|nr:thioredoxin family protein [Pedobacter sp.]HWW37828.1 thioredoxin family protein [Pedobacter sp.]
MKHLKIYMVLLMMSLSIVACAQELPLAKAQAWKAIFDQAKKENKMVLVDAYFEGCAPCKQMEETVFVWPEVKQLLADSFIFSKIDFLSDTLGKALQMKYAVTGFPTFLLFNQEGRLVSRFSGYKEGDKFLKRLKEAMSQSKSNQIMAGFSPELDVAYPAFYITLFKERKSIDIQALAEWLKGKDKTKEMYAMPLLMANNLNPELNSYFLDNYARLENLYGRELVWDKRNRIIASRLKSEVPLRDDAKFDLFLKHIKPLFSATDWPYGQLDIAENYFFNIHKDLLAFLKFAVVNFNDDDNKVRYLARNIRSEQERKVFGEWLKLVINKDSGSEVLSIAASTMTGLGDMKTAKEYGDWAAKKRELLKIHLENYQ